MNLVEAYVDRAESRSESLFQFLRETSPNEIRAAFRASNTEQKREAHAKAMLEEQKKREDVAKFIEAITNLYDAYEATIAAPLRAAERKANVDWPGPGYLK